MVGGFVNAPRTARALAAVYRFRDAFYLPFTDATPFVRSPLALAIPARRWAALPVDASYRFSETPAAMPTGTFDVDVSSVNGDYVNFEPFSLTLPLAISTPPKPSDFLIVKPLWPTRSFPVPDGETAVVGRLFSPSNAPVADLTVVMHAPGPPPPGGPYTRTDARGEFLFRFPRLGGLVAGGTVTMAIGVSGPGPIAVSPATVTLALGRLHYFQFDRS